MSKIRKKHSKEFNFKVTIEAIKEQKTTAMICKEFCVCESQVNAWKKQLKESGSYIFENNINSSKIKNQDDLEAKIKEYFLELIKTNGSKQINHNILIY